VDNGEFQTEIVAFIQRYIRSVEHLEILLLLAREPLRPWTPEAVYEIIKSNHASVQQRLRELCHDELVVVENSTSATYHFRSEDKALAALVADLAIVYKERPIRVLQIIYPGADKGQGFANAFKFRRKD
jgi:hypothetical protein